MAVPDLAEHSLDVTASTVSEATPNALNLHRARRLAVTQWTEKYILPDRSVRTWTSAAFRPGLRTVLFAVNSWRAPARYDIRALKDVMAV